LVCVGEHAAKHLGEVDVGTLGSVGDALATGWREAHGGDLLGGLGGFHAYYGGLRRMRPYDGR
jgi:hypothetical protein